MHVLLNMIYASLPFPVFDIMSSLSLLVYEFNLCLLVISCFTLKVRLCFLLLSVLPPPVIAILAQIVFTYCSLLLPVFFYFLLLAELTSPLCIYIILCSSLRNTD